MSKKFSYQTWYDKQNSQKSNLLYERLTTQFVGRSLLNEQDQQEVKKEVANFLKSYAPEKDPKVIEKVRPIVADKLSFLAIDDGDTEGRSIINFATTFVLRHLTDIQVKGDTKEIQETPSMLSDFVTLMKMIFLNAARENKDLFKQVSSVSRAKATADVLGKKIGGDFEEFGSELGRTGKQTWSDIKSGLSNLFEAAPQAAAAGAAGGGGAVVTTTGLGLQSAGVAAESAVLEAAKVKLIEAQAARLVAQTAIETNLARVTMIEKLLQYKVILGGALATLLYQCWSNIVEWAKGTSSLGAAGGAAAQAAADKIRGLLPKESSTDKEPDNKPEKQKGKKQLRSGDFGTNAF